MSTWRGPGPCGSRWTCDRHFRSRTERRARNMIFSPSEVSCVSVRCVQVLHERSVRGQSTAPPDTPALLVQSAATEFHQLSPDPPQVRVHIVRFAAIESSYSFEQLHPSNAGTS